MRLNCDYEVKLLANNPSTTILSYLHYTPLRQRCNSNQPGFIAHMFLAHVIGDRAIKSLQVDAILVVGEAKLVHVCNIYKISKKKMPEGSL